ncbi:helix-turn-helix domain-containing protein [Caldanaerobius polysaccharolyticus]|uniref:helix-turn-helix domain-containing protein n=1 Tax=Caldanaerobius polysaccharolyticus TaxID=44256 RepID=UPI00068D9B0F|nr:LexA family transcriptional regulator [Caldanaerobius polysaccharolyticus]
MNMDVKYPQFGAFLRNLRESRNWTQEDVAKQLGIPLRTWGGYEQGRRLPKDRDLLVKIAELFNIPFDELKQVLPNDVLTPHERIRQCQEQYRQYQNHVSKLGEELSTGRGPTEELLAELSDAKDKMKKTTQYLSKAFMELYPLRPVPVIPVHVAARYHGGRPLDIIDIDPNDIKDIVTVPEDHPANVALEVNGDSLIEVGINDGDYVLLDTKATAKDGDLVAVKLNGGEGVVKYYRRIKGKVYLYSANKNYKPIKVTEDMNAEIVGVVKGVWKRTPPPPPEVWSNGS